MSPYPIIEKDSNPHNLSSLSNTLGKSNAKGSFSVLPLSPPCKPQVNLKVEIEIQKIPVATSSIMLSPFFVNKGVINTKNTSYAKKRLKRMAAI